MRVSTNYSEEFRKDAVALVDRSGRSLREVAQDLGVNHWTLREWYRSSQMAKRAKAKAKIQVSGSGEESPKAKLARLEREIERLRSENESLKVDREILKKAAAFFAKESE